MAIYILVALVSYLIGSVSFSVIFTKKIAGFDVRERGSKNAGSTNVLRTAGKGVALLTLVCDILKGVVAVLLAKWIGELDDIDNLAYLVQLAGIMVVVGHTFPVFFKFKGGKGVATSLGIILLINWQIGLICLVFALILMILTRLVSLGSVAAAILFPVLTLFITDNYLVDGDYRIFGIILGIFIIGIPIAIFFIFYNGFTLGFIITSLSSIFGFKGFIYSLVYIIINKLVYLFFLYFLLLALFKIVLIIIRTFVHKEHKNKDEIFHLLKKIGLCLIIILIYDLILYFFGNKLLILFDFLIS